MVSAEEQEGLISQFRAVVGCGEVQVCDYFRLYPYSSKKFCS